MRGSMTWTWSKRGDLELAHVQLFACSLEFVVPKASPPATKPQARLISKGDPTKSFCFLKQSPEFV